MAFTNFVSRSIHGESPIIYGDGNQTRDFTYVGDVVDANRRLLDTDAADGEVLNIGSTDRIMIEELARVIRDEIDPTVEIVKTDRREGGTKHTHADVSKANELIGYEPKISIEEGANNFIQWYRRNIDWYDELVQRSK
jgi:UDP-glucose 4-epimerase